MASCHGSTDAGEAIIVDLVSLTTHVVNILEASKVRVYIRLGWRPSTWFSFRNAPQVRVNGYHNYKPVPTATIDLRTVKLSEGSSLCVGDLQEEHHRTEMFPETYKYSSRHFWPLM